MATQIGKSCLDRDGLRENGVETPHLEGMTEHWHPGLRLLIIAGGAASLWALLLILA